MTAQAEMQLWPYEPGIEHEPHAAALLQKLKERLDSLPLEAVQTPAELGRRLGARVVLARLSGQGWTWYRPQGPLIEVANWLPDGLQQLVIAHEVCHLILGPPPARDDRTSERVCNWGAGAILQRIGRRSSAGDRQGASVGGGYNSSRALATTSFQ